MGPPFGCHRASITDRRTSLTAAGRVVGGLSGWVMAHNGKMGPQLRRLVWAPAMERDLLPWYVDSLSQAAGACATYGFPR
jgi:hypothetical protein